MRINNFILRYCFRLLLREKLFIYIITILLGGLLLVTFLAHTLILEINSAQISFAAFYVRSVSVLFFVLITPFYFIRLHQSQEILCLLAQSCSRKQFLIQTTLAFLLIALSLCLASGLFLVVLQSPIAQTIQWSFSLFLECSILISMSLFLSSRLTLSSVASLITFLYYCLGRLHSYLTVPSSLAKSTKIVLKLIPTFDQFTKTEWLVVSSARPSLTSLLMEALLFASFCLILTMITYQRRWL